MKDAAGVRPVRMREQGERESEGGLAAEAECGENGIDTISENSYSFPTVLIKGESIR